MTQSHTPPLHATRTPSPQTPIARNWVDSIGLVFIAIIVVFVPLAAFKSLWNPRISQTLVAQALLYGTAMIYLPWRILWGGLSAKGGRHEGGARENLLPTDLFALGMVAALFLSAVGSRYFALTLRETLYPAALVVAFLWASHLPARRAAKWIVPAFLFAGVLVAAYSILQHYGIEILSYAEKQRRGKMQIASFLGNPNYVASFLAPLIFLAFGIFFAVRSMKARAAALGVALLFAFTLLLTGGRAAWFGAFCAAIAAVAQARRLLPKEEDDGDGAGGPEMADKPGARRKGRAGLWIGASAAAGALLLGLLLFFVRPNYSFFQRLFSMPEISQRLLPWQLAGRMVRQNPLVGIGYRQVFVRLNDAYFDFFRNTPDADLYAYALKAARGGRPDHLHNEYLQILVEHGILGLFAFFLVLAGAFRAAARHAANPNTPRDRKIAIVSIMAAVVCLLADSLWAFPLQVPATGLMFWILLGILAACAHADLQSSEEQEPLPATPAPSSARRHFSEAPSAKYGFVFKLKSIAAAAAAALFLFAGFYVSIEKIAAMRIRVRVATNPRLLSDNPQTVRDLEWAYARTLADDPPPFEFIDALVAIRAYPQARQRILDLMRAYNIGDRGYMQLGTVCMKMGDMPAARDSFEKALVLAPGAPDVLELIAYLDIQQGRAEDAMRRLYDAMREEPLRPNVYYLMGVIYENLKKNPEAARDYYRRALRANAQYKGTLMFDPARVAKEKVLTRAGG